MWNEFTARKYGEISGTFEHGDELSFYAYEKYSLATIATHVIEQLTTVVRYSLC
jgi:hypothetical protein